MRQGGCQEFPPSISSRKIIFLKNEKKRAARVAELKKQLRRRAISLAVYLSGDHRSKHNPPLDALFFTSASGWEESCSRYLRSVFVPCFKNATRSINS
jgi:hypothetical protein